MVEAVSADGEVTEIASGDVRRSLYSMRRDLRPLQRPRVRACGYAKHGPDVQLVIDEHRQAQYRGLQHCSCAWECPVCSMLIKTRRRAEIEAAAEAWGSTRIVMLSLTLSHARKDSLRTLREGLSRAYTAMTRGAPWVRFCRHIGLAGSVRAIELTHGANGWHPHIHVLWFLNTPPDHGEWTDQGLQWVIPNNPLSPRAAERDPFVWLAKRWQTMVERNLGASNIPTLERGAVATLLHDPKTGEPVAGANYIAKLGLEITGPGKAGKRGNRTPLQIARDFAVTGKRRDAALWRIYSRGMRGARQLTWSLGLRQRLGVAGLSDAEIISEHEEAGERDRRLGIFSGELWASIRRRRVDGVPGPYHILHEVTEHGPGAMRRAVAEVATSKEIDGEINRSETMGLLHWLPEYKGPPKDPRGNPRPLVCPGCGGRETEGPEWCLLHWQVEPFSKQARRYRDRQADMEVSWGVESCACCEQWLDGPPTQRCTSPRHHARHGIKRCDSCGRWESRYPETRDGHELECKSERHRERHRLDQERKERQRAEAAA